MKTVIIGGVAVVVLVGVLLLLAVLLIPALHGLFLVADLTLAQLGMILGLAVLPTLCIQITRIARGK